MTSKVFKSVKGNELVLSLVLWYAFESVQMIKEISVIQRQFSHSLLPNCMNEQNHSLCLDVWYNFDFNINNNLTSISLCLVISVRKIP